MTADLLLIGHGSRDPGAARELDELVARLRPRLGPARVAAGYLELAEPHIDAALDELVAAGAQEIAAVPYVLFGAGHLKDDGPAVLGRARRRHPGVEFRLARDLGIHPLVLDVAEDRVREALSHLPASAHAEGGPPAVIVVARGSSDPDACADVVKFARLLGDGRGLGPVEAAFADVSRPDVDEALERCRKLGARQVVVLPLLLFTGRVVGRLADQVAAWTAAVEPSDQPVTTVVARHLGADDRLADLVALRHREAWEGDVRMNCDMCAYRVRLPGYEDKQGLPLSLAPTGASPRGWRARRAANQAAAEEAERRKRPRIGLGRRRRAAPGAASAEPGPVGRPVVRVEGLVHRFPDGTEALRGVDLAVREGERVALLGPNGSGKTTLALHLIGALDRRAGLVEVAGLPVTARHLAEIRRQVGLVFQDPDDQLLLPTVAADVALGPSNLGLRPEEVAERVRWALEEVGLVDLGTRAPQHLSLGERRRAALAGVLAMRPSILILDEPSANLDPSARRDLAEIVGGVDLTTIVITHDLSLALELCPRSVVIDHGRIAADGPTRQLLANRPLLEAHRLELPFGLVLP